MMKKKIVISNHISQAPSACVLSDATDGHEKTKFIALLQGYRALAAFARSLQGRDTHGCGGQAANLPLIERSDGSLARGCSPNPDDPGPSGDETPEEEG